MDKPSFETEDLKANNRSLAAKKAATTRKRNAVAERDQFFRDKYLVHSFDDYEAYFGTSTPVAEIVSELIASIDSSDPDSFSLAESDLVVWNCYRVVAIIRNGPDGRPVGTIF